MKIRQTIFTVMTLLTASVVLSQTLFDKSVSVMSVTEAQEVARAADTGTAALQFFEAAMKSGRLEIIEVCWQGIYTHDLLSKAVTEMPDSSIKDQLVSRFLRNPRIWWPSDSPIAMGMDMPRTGKVQFIIPLVRRYLPDTPLDYSIISTQEMRLKLADAFDVAAGIPIEKEPDAKHVWPPKPGDKPGVPSAPTQQDGTASKPNALIPAAAKSGENTPLTGGWALWAGIATLLAIVAGWLLLCTKRKKG